ncbi:hypothetical protein EMMF5_000882 [Cystobasidiomycetes sp. EMM_F5]
MSATDPIKPLVIDPPERANSALVFLHGFGDRGDSPLLVFVALPDTLTLESFTGYQNLADQIHKAGKLQAMRFVFPTASFRQDEGERAWYPLKSVHMDDDTLGDLEDYREAVHIAEDLIRKQEKAGIPRSRIVLGGFSQGSAVTFLWSILNQNQPQERIAGLVCIAGYVPMRGKFKDIVESDRALLADQPLVIIHGQQDSMLPLWVARKGIPVLEELGFEVNWAEVAGMQHNVPGQAIRILCRFLESVLEQ